MREADDEAMVRAAIYVDTRAGALAESGELVHALAAASSRPRTYAASSPNSHAAASAGVATREKSPCSKASAARSRIWQRPSWLFRVKKPLADPLLTPPKVEKFKHFAKNSAPACEPGHI